MADENSKTVTVERAPKGTNFEGAKVEHKANNIEVKDGHLFVLQYSNVVAVYAPSKWINAVMSE